MGEGIAEANPVIGSNRPVEGPPRERVLSDYELLAIWNACGTGDYDYGRIVRVLVLTGCRREEVGGLRWSEIDLFERLIRLPAERCKNGRAHDVPLSDWAWPILVTSPQPSTGAHVFGRDNTGSRR